MTSILIQNAAVATICSAEHDAGPRRGEAMDDIGLVDSTNVAIRDGVIESVGNIAAAAKFDRTIDAAGRVLMPGFVDCHTHACWAGERVGEWEQRLRGADYLEILAKGGGILSTVNSVRESSEEELSELLLTRLNTLLYHGTTTVEVKSGYGLNTETELKMLRAIRVAGDRWAGRVIPTACIGHAIDPAVDRDSFVNQTISETLPAVTNEFPGIAIDAYCEQGAWTLEESLRLFDAAKEAGHMLRVHADQFHSIGMVGAAIERNFRSVDHLEATGDGDLKKLAASETCCVVLPCSGFHLDGRYANARKIVDAGGAVAIATNWNPGSAPCPSMPMAMALATRHCGLTPAEAITAATINAAFIVGENEVGQIQEGRPADLILLEHDDPRELAFSFGGDPVRMVICGGKIVRENA